MSGLIVMRDQALPVKAKSEGLRYDACSVSSLCVQVQPNRAPSVDLSVVREMVAQINSSSLVRKHDEQVGDDYVNFIFGTEALHDLWELLWTKLFQHERVGAALRRSSIVTCQGPQGWDDYLLLHHFDPAVSLDKVIETY